MIISASVLAGTRVSPILAAVMLLLVAAGGVAASVGMNPSSTGRGTCTPSFCPRTCSPSAHGASLCLQKPQIRCTLQGHISAGLVSGVALEKVHFVPSVIISTAVKCYHSI